MGPAGGDDMSAADLLINVFSQVPQVAEFVMRREAQLQLVDADSVGAGVFGHHVKTDVGAVGLGVDSQVLGLGTD